MDQFASQASSAIAKFCTAEVFQLIGICIAAIVGWRVTNKVKTGFASASERLGYSTLVATLMIIAGVGSTGLGFGELVCRYTNSPSSPHVKGINNKELIVIADKCKDNPELVRTMLDYANVRDGIPPATDVAMLAKIVEKNPDNKSLVAFLGYMRAREQGIACKKEFREAVAANFGDEPLPAFLSNDAEFTSKITNTSVQNSDTLVTMPVAWTMICAGLATMFCGITCWKNRANLASVQAQNK